MKYRIETKKRQLERYARIKFKQYSMEKWRLQFIEGTKYTSYAYCEPAWKTISMNISTVAEYKLVTLKDIFLHELAHGIVGIKRPFHGKEFQNVCKEIGCKGFRARNNYEVFDIYGQFKNPINEKCVAIISKKADVEGLREVIG